MAYPETFEEFITDWDYVTYHYERDHIPLINVSTHIQHALGLNIAGNKSSLADRLNVSLNANGFIDTTEFQLQLRPNLPTIPSLNKLKLFVDLEGSVKTIDSSGNVRRIGETIDFKESCVVATTENLDATYDPQQQILTANNNGILIIDTITLSENDRVLVKDQTLKQYNGIYFVWDTGAVDRPWKLRRALDANKSMLVTTGMYTYVEKGSPASKQEDTGWVLVTKSPIYLDTTPLDFTIFGPGTIYHNRLQGLDEDDHVQYLLTNGTRDITGIIKYTTHPTFNEDTQLVDKKYVDDAVSVEDIFDRDDINGYIYPKVLTDKFALGKNSPDEILDILGNFKLTGNIIPNNDNTSNLGSETNRFANLYLVSNINHSNNLTFNTDKITITTDGKVGIGITNPTESLEISGNIKTNSDIEITNSTKGLILKSDNGTQYRIKVDNNGVLSTESI